MRQKKKSAISREMDYNYLIKVYADAVGSGLRGIETIPEVYLDDVTRELDRRHVS